MAECVEMMADIANAVYDQAWEDEMILIVESEMEIKERIKTQSEKITKFRKIIDYAREKMNDHTFELQRFQKLLLKKQSPEEKKIEYYGNALSMTDMKAFASMFFTFVIGTQSARSIPSFEILIAS
jgi:hypothetical protein